MLVTGIVWWAYSKETIKRRRLCVYAHYSGQEIHCLRRLRCDAFHTLVKVGSYVQSVSKFTRALPSLRGTLPNAGACGVCTR